MRVLFVDDEMNVLSGYRRSMRAKRDLWDCQFVPGGAEALELMEAEKFDLIISDMRMPGMDGGELLRRVKEQSPEIIRFLLSGQTSPADLLRSVDVAHQFLGKPCELEILEGAIQKATVYWEELKELGLLREIALIPKLPPLPPSYFSLCAEIELTDPSLDDIAEIVSYDAGLTARITTRAYSSFFGTPPQAHTMKDLCTFLGLDVFAHLAASLESSQESLSDTPEWLFEFHTNCMLAAKAAREMAQAQGMPPHQVMEAELATMIRDLSEAEIAWGRECGSQFSDLLVANQRKALAWRLGMRGVLPSITTAIAGDASNPLTAIVDAALAAHRPMGLAA